MVRCKRHISFFLLHCCLVLSLAPQDPVLVWKKLNPYSVLGPVVQQNGSIIFSDRSGSVTALLPDGKLLWKYRNEEGTFSAVTAVAGGTLLMTTTKSLVALNPDGTLLWKLRIPSPSRGKPVFYRDHIWICTSEGQCLRFDLKGNRTGDVNLSRKIFTSPVSDGRGHFFVSSLDYSLLKLDIEGKILWEIRTGGVLRRSAVPVRSRYVIQGSMDHCLYHIKSQNGKINWIFKTGYWILSSPGITPAGDIIFGGMDKHLYLLDRRGRQKWKLELRAATRVTPVCRTDKEFYTADDSGTIYRISPEEKKSWMYKGTDAVHTPLTLLNHQGDDFLFAASIDGWISLFRLPD